MSQTIIEEERNHFQNAYRKSMLTPDIENSYRKQNLPIRRQSLQVFQKDYIIKKIPTQPEEKEKKQQHERRRCVSNPNLLLTVTSSKQQEDQEQPVKQSTAHKFVELLRPSKSEVTFSQKKKKPTENRLKHVFSRLQKKPALFNDQPVYTALLSCVSKEFSKRISLKPIAVKDGIEYHNTFTGSEAVDCLLNILKIRDRNFGLLIGRALENQNFIHHVTYDCRLRDLDNEFYQLDLENGDNSSVNSVFTILTDCYSPTCTRKNPCYSNSCPRMKRKNNTETCNSSTAHLSRKDQEYLKDRVLWRYSVPLDIVMETNDKEKKRQECIYELVYTEQDFTRDLQYIKEFWIQPIQSSDIVPLERRQEFITNVFWNLIEIEKISSSLSKALTTRQDKHSVIPCIGDIMISHVKNFGPFVTYGAHQMIGKHTFEMEKKMNPRFQQFVMNLERRPESRRLELNGYLTKPTSRLGRYNLLLNSIHQVTPKDHKDYKDIPIAMDLITQFLIQLNHQVGLSDNTFHLQQLSNRILPFKGPELELLNPKRQLVMRGKMKRTKSTSLQLFLFDNYLVVCKVKLVQQLEYYKLYQKIQLENYGLIQLKSTSKTNIIILKHVDSDLRVRIV
ncbi:hypothetical protein G6F57_005779 [Rhizopus arrhizus]|nr:hypothetical protein G6F30_007501 [Rhizopus arrhizus]KAG0980399.1 hypothetical protein G6F29_007860 [Rhizopus arrhizus]KAG0995430.1 hypothetical protein G6F28_004806 [Rhizopus arrhizus]KAG1012898.1 hypothetical protein G6F27_002394 [Rhizopus arrhizus]KAG1029822.1 hypothetical protein G6F26_001402 [Rhizopus arrhizus]